MHFAVIESKPTLLAANSPLLHIYCRTIKYLTLYFVYCRGAVDKKKPNNFHFKIICFAQNKLAVKTKTYTFLSC